MSSPTPVSSKRRNLGTWQRARISAAAVLLIGIIGGMVAACSETTAPASPTASATSRPTATPTVSATEYKDAVTLALNGVFKAFNKFASDCQESDITTTVCRNDLQAVHDATVNAQSTLDKHPAPACLKAADARIREAMTDYHDGITLIRQGIDSNDSGTIQVGIDLLLDGDKELSKAAVEIDDASCGATT